MFLPGFVILFDMDSNASAELDKALDNIRKMIDDIEERVQTNQPNTQTTGQVGSDMVFIS